MLPLYWEPELAYWTGRTNSQSSSVPGRICSAVGKWSPRSPRAGVHDVVGSSVRLVSWADVDCTLHQWFPSDNYVVVQWNWV